MKGYESFCWRTSECFYTKRGEVGWKHDGTYRITRNLFVLVSSCHPVRDTSWWIKCCDIYWQTSDI